MLNTFQHLSYASLHSNETVFVNSQLTPLVLFKQPGKWQFLAKVITKFPTLNKNKPKYKLKSNRMLLLV